MDYEQRYKEALERAKTIKHNIEITKGSIDEDMLEEIFPELAESEDERIRKWIVNLLHELQYNETAQPLALKAIEWLEKQKAPENTSVSTMIPSCWETEQKPAEPSMEELEAHQKELHDFKVFAAKQAKEHHISFVHDFEWNNFCGEILSYFNRPAEWSEEDEEMLNDLIGALERNQVIHPDGYLTTDKVGNNKKRVKDFVSWLKSLKPQPKQEWSEEDEDMLEWICRIIHYNTIKNYTTSEDETKLTTWIKSLKPQSHWKPSEEQMEALERCVDYLEESDNEDYDIMESLLTDLRKLKEDKQ